MNVGVDGLKIEVSGMGGRTAVIAPILSLVVILAKYWLWKKELVQPDPVEGSLRKEEVMTEVKGIEGLKSELDFGFALFGAFKQAQSDGKIGLEDIGLILPLVGPAEAAFAKRLQLGDELKDLSTAEAEQLAAYIAGKLGSVADAALVAKVVAVMNALKANYAAYKAFAG